MKRTIIINWKWNFGESPKGVLFWGPKGTGPEVSNSDLDSLKKIIAESKYDYSDDNSQVLKLNFNLHGYHIREKSEAKQRIATILKDHLKPGPNHHCLFLFHNKPEHINDPENFRDENDYMRYFSFDGGNDTRIYGRKALLNGGGTAYDSDKSAVWNTEKSCFEINASCFKHVWDQYWYQVLWKLHHFRESFYYSQLPGFPGEAKREVQEKAGELVNFYKEKGKTHLKEDESKKFIEELEKFYAGGKTIDKEPFDAKPLNEILHCLIARWNHEILS